MTRPLIHLNDIHSNHAAMLDRIFLSSDSFTLSPQQIHWATRLSQAAPTHQQWQVYLNAVAFLGVTQWLQERAPELSIQSDWFMSSRSLDWQIDRTQQDTLAQSLGNLTVGGFRLHLIAVDNPADDVVLVSRAMVEQSDAMPHFYLLVEVLEELAQVRISGYLSTEQLTRRFQTATLEQEDADTNLLPLNWFDPNSSNLLLYLSCLEPSPIHSSTHPPIYQRAVNAGLWLRNQLDQVAESLSWILVPPTLQSAMMSVRSTADQMNRVMSDLIDRGDIELPPQIGHAYQDISFRAATLRLYALVWELPNAEDIPEWMLLVILGTPIGTPLSTDVRLQIRDETQLLADTVLERHPDTYLYAQVSGRQDEQFYITVSLEDEKINLDPIGFNLS